MTRIYGMASVSNGFVPVGNADSSWFSAVLGEIRRLFTSTAIPVRAKRGSTGFSRAAMAVAAIPHAGLSPLNLGLFFTAVVSSGLDICLSAVCFRFRIQESHAEIWWSPCGRAIFSVAVGLVCCAGQGRFTIRGSRTASRIRRFHFARGG